MATDVSSDAFNRPQRWEQEKIVEIALQKHELPQLARELERLERDYRPDFESGFISESPQRLRQRIYRYYRALVGEDDFQPVDCNAPWVSAVIETDGAVRPCFFQPPLGNLYEEGSFAAILNSPQALAWRQGLDTHRDEICRKCVCSLQLRETSPEGA